MTHLIKLDSNDRHKLFSVTNERNDRQQQLNMHSVFDYLKIFS